MAWTTVHSRPPKFAYDYGLGAAASPPFQRGVRMNTHNFSAADQHEYVLAEFRCALVKAKLAQHDIEAVALALKCRLITPEQAVAMFWDLEAVRFLGIKLEHDLDLTANVSEQMQANNEVRV
jgi:hypothetical protein